MLNNQLSQGLCKKHIISQQKVYERKEQEMKTRANAYYRQNLIFSPISSAIANWFIYNNQWFCDIVVDSDLPFLLATREHTNFQAFVLGWKLVDPQLFSFLAEKFLFDFFGFYIS